MRMCRGRSSGSCFIDPASLYPSSFLPALSFLLNPFSFPMLTPGFLVPFHSKQAPHFFTDVLVIGSGLAGLRAARPSIQARRSWWSPRTNCRNPTAHVPRADIAAFLDPADHCEDHVADTLEAGGSLCDVEVVRRVTGECRIASRS